jgi:hypothetical protein
VRIWEQPLPSSEQINFPVAKFKLKAGEHFKFFFEFINFVIAVWAWGHARRRTARPS